MIFLGELNESNIDNIMDTIMSFLDREENKVNSVTAVYDCIKGKIPYDQTVKDWAQWIIDNGKENQPIFIQCLANGNIQMAQEVVDEAKAHYDVFAKEVSKKYDNAGE